MIVSHKYEFIFIKTAKTAGTSLELYYHKLAGSQDIITTNELTGLPDGIRRGVNDRGYFNPFREMLEYRGLYIDRALRDFFRRTPFSAHIAARTLKCRLPRKIWDKYYKFAVERNPWDKTLSHFHMLKSLSGGNLTLDEYFARGKFCLNYPLYTDRMGALMVNRILQYENLDEDLREVFDLLGVPFSELTENANAAFRSDRTPYQDVFSPEQCKVIEHIFSQEIAMHGYRFDQAKN